MVARLVVRPQCDSAAATRRCDDHGVVTSGAPVCRARVHPPACNPPPLSTVAPPSARVRRGRNRRGVRGRSGTSTGSSRSLRLRLCCALVDPCSCVSVFVHPDAPHLVCFCSVPTCCCVSVSLCVSPRVSGFVDATGWASVAGPLRTRAPPPSHQTIDAHKDEGDGRRQQQKGGERNTKEREAGREGECRGWTQRTRATSNTRGRCGGTVVPDGGQQAAASGAV